MRGNKLKSQPGEYIIASTMSVILLLAVLCYIPYDFNRVFLIYFLCVCTLVLWGCARVKWMRYAVPATLLLTFIIYLLTLNTKTDFTQVIDFCNGYLSWVYESVTIYRVPPPEYLMLSGIFISLAIAFPVYALIRVRGHFSVPLFIGITVFTGIQLLGLEFPFFLLLLYLLLVVIYAVWQGGGLPQGIPGIMYLLLCLPLCMLIALTAWLLPVSDNALGEPLLDGVTGVFEDIFGVLPSEFDTFSFSHLQGQSSFFGEMSNRLGGPNRSQSDKIMLYIQGDKPLYLKGRTADVYTGTSWDSSGSDAAPYERNPLPSQPPYFAPLAEQNKTAFKSALKLPVIVPVFNMIGDSDVGSARTRIFFWDIRTRSIFLPENAVDVKIDTSDKAVYSIDKESAITADKMRRKEFYYTVYTPSYKLTRDEWDEIYSFCAQWSIDEYLNYLAGWASVIESYRSADAFAKNWIDAGYSDADVTDAAFSTAYDYLVDYYERGAEQVKLQPFWVEQRTEGYRVHRDYTELPPSVPKRVRDLAHEIVAPLGPRANDYEKARAIEAYLIENYIYNLEVPETPEGREFTDYFLFDLEEGYCTYFATAMTVLCRELGIPARYAEGFAPSNQKIGELYYVTGAQAHAWPEIYIDLCGWVQFEPTPAMHESYNSDYFMGGNYKPETDTSSAPEATPSPQFSAGPNEEKDEPYAQDENTTISEEQFKLPVFVIVIMCVVFAVFSLPIAHLLRRKYNNYRVYRNPIAAEDVEWLYKKFVKLFVRLGITQRCGETALEYGRRVDECNYLYGTTMEKIAGIYSASRYGHKPPSEDDIRQLKLLWEKREKIAESQTGDKMRLIYKHFLGYL